MPKLHDHLIGNADRKKISDPKVDSILKEFREVPKEATVASRWLTSVWNELGKPPTPFSEAGQKLMKVIIAVWQDLYPLDARVWFAERSEYQKAELSITQQVHGHTGRSLASYPYPIYQMMKKLFPDFNRGERKNVLRLIKIFPMFRFANKA
jgi:hypothetical protein